MIKRINHIAIVVADLDQAIQTYRDRIGLTLAKRLTMPEQEVEIAFLPAGESMIELIQPITADSGVAKYLARRGEGLHHICLEVDDVRPHPGGIGRPQPATDQRGTDPGRRGLRFLPAPQGQPRRVDRVPGALRRGGPGI